MADKLYQIYKFWSSENKPFHRILISVYYNKIVAKTNRISGLFKGDQSNYAIVGAKFNTEKKKHIITYFLSLDDLIRSMELLYKVDNVLSNKFKDGIDRIAFNNKNIINKIDFKKYSLTKSLFKQIIADVSYIENFEVEKATQLFKESIITLYNTGIDTKQLFQNIGIDLLSNRILDNNTVFLDENQFKVLFEKYLISFLWQQKIYLICHRKILLWIISRILLIFHPQVLSRQLGLLIHYLIIVYILVNG